MRNKTEKKIQKPIDGNGKNHEQELEDTMPAPALVAINQSNAPAPKQRKYEEIDDSDKNIPGNKFLFNVKDEHLDEATRLNEREIWTFSIAEVQDAVLSPLRTDSVIALLMKSIKRKKIGFEGKGREEYVTTMQLSAEEKSDKSGDLFAKGL